MKDNMDLTLESARDTHRARTGHSDVFRGLNFVECLTCKRHGHYARADTLIVHGASRHSEQKLISPTDF